MTLMRSLLLPAELQERRQNKPCWSGRPMPACLGFKGGFSADHLLTHVSEDDPCHLFYLSSHIIFEDLNKHTSNLKKFARKFSPSNQFLFKPCTRDPSFSL